MPTITLTATQAQVDRLLASLPPDYEATAAGAKQFLIDCVQERIRAKEARDNELARPAAAPVSTVAIT
mgnify:CR=1 FL=1